MEAEEVIPSKLEQFGTDVFYTIFSFGSLKQLFYLRSYSKKLQTNIDLILNQYLISYIIPHFLIPIQISEIETKEPIESLKMLIKYENRPWERSREIMLNSKIVLSERTRLLTIIPENIRYMGVSYGQIESNIFSLTYGSDRSKLQALREINRYLTDKPSLSKMIMKMIHFDLFTQFDLSIDHENMDQIFYNITNLFLKIDMNDEYTCDQIIKNNFSSYLLDIYPTKNKLNQNKIIQLIHHFCMNIKYIQHIGSLNIVDFLMNDINLKSEFDIIYNLYLISKLIKNNETDMQIMIQEHNLKIISEKIKQIKTISNTYIISMICYLCNLIFINLKKTNPNLELEIKFKELLLKKYKYYEINYQFLLVLEHDSSSHQNDIINTLVLFRILTDENRLKPFWCERDINSFIKLIKINNNKINTLIIETFNNIMSGRGYLFNNYRKLIIESELLDLIINLFRNGDKIMRGHISKLIDFMIIDQDDYKSDIIDRGGAMIFS